jgi:hypothetical protein
MLFKSALELFNFLFKKLKEAITEEHKQDKKTLPE